MNRALLELQEIDSALLRLTRQKAALDDGTQARAQRDQLQKELETTQAALRASESKRGEREAQLQATEAKIAKQKQRVMNVSSAHEISALERDIEGLNRARSDHDEAILTLMDESETLAARVVTLEKLVSDAQTSTTKIEVEFKDETTRLDTALLNRRRERTETAARLSAPEKAKYDNSYQKHHGVAVATNIKGNCSACGMTITPFALREAETLEFPTCESCGRLLFLE